MADGILTPAVSVTSAAAGIAVAKPSISGDVMGIALVSIFPSLLQTPVLLTGDRDRRFLYPFSSRNPLVREGWVLHSRPVSNSTA